MATRDPHIISEHLIPTDGGIAIVQERKDKDEIKYQVMNPAEVPAAFHSSAIDQAKETEAPRAKPDRKKSL